LAWRHSMVFRRKGDKAHYNFLDKTCLGRSCWAPGMYQHRSPMSCGGSRNTGSPDSPCCLNRAYHGCPDGPVGEHVEYNEYLKTDCLHVGLPVFQPDLAAKRKSEGWKAA